MVRETRKITLGTTYYNNPDNIKAFIDTHIEYCDELIIVDDASTIFAADKIIEPHPKIKLFRVIKDIGFNSHGCRNLIMKMAENDWVCLLDSDRALHEPGYAFDSMRSRKLKTNCRYRFVAHRSNNYSLGSAIHGSVNDYLIHRNHFFSAGGYDEEIAGVRNGDRQFFEQLLHFGTEEILFDIDLILLRDATNYLNNPILNPSSSNMTLKQKNLIEKRIRTPEPNKPIIQFEWKRVI